MITYIFLIVFFILSLAIIIWHFYKRKTDKTYYENSIFEADVSYYPNRTRIALIGLIILTIVVYIFIVKNGSSQ